MAGEHILVADDEHDLAQLVAINLELAGYRATTEADGESAVARVRAEPVDLLLLDVMMPRLDGWQVLAALQDDEATRELPVVMLTALANERDVIRGHLSGAVRYITKPFDLESLLGTVREALEPLDEAERTARAQQLRAFLTRLAELDSGRSAAPGPGGPVRLSRLEGPPRPAPRPPAADVALAALSSRQREIAGMLGAGWDARRIADELGTSRSNVYAARKRIARHLGVAPAEVPEESRRLGLPPAER